MQVSHAELADTHAVIGGAAPQAFGMAETAEFYTVLSDTLYQHKKLAAVREPICNGWDAHIKAGGTHLPLEITLTETEVIFQDFGPGIPHDMVRTVYCVYGGSTKVLDKKQTGGFGLGSKAPFAYSDHFTVTVCHGGLKVIYAISRGGIETGGKPDIRAMVTVPTQETGVTVNIPLKKPEHMSTFRDNIEQVVREGGIKAKLNGHELARNKYTTARETGYVLLGSRNAIARQGSVFVLSGTVIYPVSPDPSESSKTVARAWQMVPMGYKLLLIDDLNAPGIAPVPSREALSYSEITKATLDKLAKRFLQDMQHHIPTQKRLFWDAQVKSATGLRTYATINELPLTICDTPQTSARMIVRDKASAPRQFNDKDAPDFIAAMRRKFPKMRASLRRFEGAVKTSADGKNKFRQLHYYLCKMAFEAEMKPMLRVLNETGAHKFLRLFEVRGGTQTFCPKHQKLSHHRVAKTIILAQNRAEASLAMEKETKGTFDHQTFVCLFIPRRDEALREKVIAAAERRGIPLINTKPIPAKPKEPKKEVPKKTYDSLNQFCQSLPATVTEPSCYILVGGNQDDAASAISSLPIKFLKERYGDVVVVRRAQLSAVKAANIPTLMELMEKELLKAKMSRSLLVGVLMSRRIIVEGRAMTWTIQKLLERHPETFFEFTSYKGVKREKAGHFAHLFGAFERIVGMDPIHHDIATSAQTLVNDVLKAALALAREEGPSYGQHHKDTYDIEAISGSNVSAAALPLVINFIRALKRANLEKKA